MDKKCKEWYRFNSSKIRGMAYGFFAGFFLIIIIDQLLIHYNIFDNESELDLLYIELIDLGILLGGILGGFLYTNVWFGLSSDTLYYVRYGKLKGSYNINNCKFERDYKPRRMVFSPYNIKSVTSRIRIAVETEQGERHILKGTGFSITTFDKLFERMKELQQYDNESQNGKFMLPQQVFRKQLIHQSWLHIFDSWKTPWKIEFGGSFVTVGKHAFFKNKMDSINLIIDGTVRKLVVQLKEGKKVFYLGTTDDTILDIERMQNEIQKFMK